MFRVNAQTGEIFIYDEIGPAWWGMIDAATVIEALEELDGKRALVRLNSPGGSMDEGKAIYNALERYSGGVDTTVDSLAASMAADIFMVGEKRTMAANSMLMIHNAWTFAWGNAGELRNVADVLDKYDVSQVQLFAQATGKTVEEIAELLDAETWLTADEAVAEGFADEIGNVTVDEPLAVAKGRFRNTPESRLVPDRITKAKAGTKTPFRSVAAARVKIERARI